MGKITGFTIRGGINQSRFRWEIHIENYYFSIKMKKSK